MHVHAIGKPLSNRKLGNQLGIGYRTGMPFIVQPHLDAPCGKHLRYRDLIECSKTWHGFAQMGKPIDNHPRTSGTWHELNRLTSLLLDPVIDQFGAIELTYAFAGPALAKEVRRAGGTISPTLDQHASCELNKNGRLICDRGGAAVDLRVPSASSREVAVWLATNRPFDRLFFYGDGRPFHVSAAPSPVGQIIQMWTGPSGRLIPKRISIATLRKAPCT